MAAIYTAVVTIEGGREGHARSSDGRLDLQLTAPKADNAAPGTNPEQLFAAGYGACFESALRSCARRAGQTLSGTRIVAHVSLNKLENNSYALSVELHGQVEGLQPAQAMELMEAAHQLCPYSVATRGNVDVQLFVDDWASATVAA